MNENLDKELVEKYPKIFRDRYGDMKKTLMCWGFECGDGWYNILDALCSNIQHNVDWQRKQRARALILNRKIKKAIELNSIEPIINHHTGNWWVERCEEILAEKKLEDVPKKVHQVVAMQVKEKFGTLSFYYGGGDENVHGMVRMAESMSARMCEVCGNPGKVRRGGWIKTLCDVHAEGREEVEHE
jgi:hypothetical protein